MFRTNIETKKEKKNITEKDYINFSKALQICNDRIDYLNNTFLKFQKEANNMMKQVSATNIRVQEIQQRFFTLRSDFNTFKRGERCEPAQNAEKK